MSGGSSSSQAAQREWGARRSPAEGPASASAEDRTSDPASTDDREALVTQARERNPQAFAPWTRRKSRKSAGVIKPARGVRRSAEPVSARRARSNSALAAWACFRGAKGNSGRPIAAQEY